MKRFVGGSWVIGFALLVIVFAASHASAQLIQPTAQDRVVYGQASATDGVDSDDTGYISDQPAVGDYGVWAGSASGTASIPAGASATFSSSYTGGWNGDDTISIEAGMSSGNLSGGGPEGCTMYANQGQRFSMTFLLPQNVNYTLTYSLGGAALVEDMVLSIEEVGGSVAYSAVAAAPSGFAEATDLTGTLAAGEYTISVEAHAEVTVVGPGGNGGGNGMTFTFQVEAAPLLGDLNCDEVVDLFDIDPFVLALTNGPGYAAAYPNCDIYLADINQDSAIDLFDIDPFVILLTD